VATSIQQNIEAVQMKIAKATERSGRSLDQIRMVAVSKNQPVSMIQEAIQAGITDLGENRVQEATLKHQQIEAAVDWHLVGHLQTNKVRPALEIFDLIHSVDRLRLLDRIQKQAEKNNRQVEVLIQINAPADESKFGLDPEYVLNFFESAANLDRVQISGLMTIGKFSPDPEESRPFFAQLRHLMDLAETQHFPNFRPKYLSMGMSNDFEVAIEEGANLVRIGTAIFGERQEA
jgi:hypothetical protein